VAIITIYSGTYCRAGETAAKIAENLGYRIYDNQIIEEAAKRFDSSSDKFLKSIMGHGAILNRFTRDREKNVARLRLILAEYIAKNDCIIQGHAGLLAPRTIPHILKVCIIANFDYRVKNAMEEKSASQKEAEKIIHQDDRENIDWTGYLFGKPPYDASLYDIVIPMHSHSVEEAAETICKYAASDQLKTSERSQAAAEGAILSAKINLAIVEAGHDVEVSFESGTAFITIDKEVLRMKQLESELKTIASKFEGVQNVEIRLGQHFRTSSMNPWSNIEIPPKILLVDDEKDFVQTLSQRLKTRNLESSVVYDGEQALEYISKDQPDVMVLDLMMPGIDGIEVLRRVKKTNPEIEVIILTGHGSKHEEEQAENLGAFAYLQKPVNIDLLARVLNEAYARINRIKAARSKPDHPEES